MLAVCVFFCSGTGVVLADAVASPPSAIVTPAATTDTTSAKNPPRATTPAAAANNPLPKPATNNPAPVADQPTVLGSVEFDEMAPDTSAYPPLKPVDALNEALIAGPKAAAIRAQFGITHAGYALATQAPNPVFFLDRGIVAEQENRVGPILTEEPIWKLLFRLLIQKRQLDQNRMDLMTQLWQLRSSVRRAYTEVVVAQETLKTLNELYQLSARLETVANKRFVSGDVPGLDYLRARLAASQTNADRIAGVQRVLSARQQLNLLLGRDVDRPINVPSLPDFVNTKTVLPAEQDAMLPDFRKNLDPVDTYIETGFSNRPELRSLSEQLLVNRANLQAAYGNIFPNPSLALGKSTSGNVPTGPKLTAVFFTFNVGVPSTNINQGSIALYKATDRQLRYQIKSQRNQIVAAVTMAYQNLIAARNKLQKYQDFILRDSAEVARLARRSYEVGHTDITTTLSAQQENVQIRSSYLDAVSSYQAAFNDLEQASGLPLE
jgi:outer membrane protein, heavy metal efflux system